MESSDQKWVVKNVDGQILGPFTTTEILNKINAGEFSGEESVSFYPEINWKPITQDLTFYDELLKSLSDQIEEDAESGSLNLKNSETQKDSDLVNDSSVIADDNVQKKEITNNAMGSSPSKVDHNNKQEPNDQGLNSEQKNKKSSARKIKNESQQNTSSKSNIDAKTNTKSGVHSKTNSNTGTNTKSEFNSKTNSNTKTNSSHSQRDTAGSGVFSTNPRKKEVIDLKDQVELDKKVKKNSTKKPFIVLTICLMVLMGWIFMPTNKKKGRIRLIQPSTKIKKIESGRLKEILTRGLRYYELDTKKNYLKAQSHFVQILESEPKNHQVWSFLCLTYLEIWPFSYQDNRDKKTISNAVQKASKYNLGGMSASTCQAVDLLLKGRLEESKSISESVLANYGSQGEPPIVFYYLKALQLKESKDFDVAIGYARSAQKLWPAWIRVYALEAELHELNGKHKYAAAIYRNILSSNPDHNYSKIKLGVIEYKNYHHIDLASQLIKEALQSKDLPPGNVVAAGYMTLSDVALKYNNEDESVMYAKKTYALNPLNLKAKNRVIKLDGIGSLGKLKLDVREMIYEGDQYFRQGEYETAQAHYQTAFELDNKNAQAALKAAKCMWKLSFSEAAIQWLNKAIKADPKLLESYITLSKYYAEKFNFSLAATILKKANSISPNSYEVFRGFSFVELKRQSYKSAIQYAQRAIKLYETDIESYVIMSQAYLGLRNFQEAYASAAKAIEIDTNHKLAQSIYAKALGGLQGTEVGVSYITGLVASFPLVVEYRLTWGEILLDDERYFEAEAVLTHLTDIDRKFYPGFLLLGRALKFQQKYNEAIDVFFKAAILNPADATSLFEAGLVYFEMKKLNKAKQQFHRVLNVNERYTNAHYYLGQIALIKSNYKEALAQADDEIRMNPNIPAAYLLKAETYLSMKKYGLCASEYQNAIKLSEPMAKNYIRVAKCYRLSGNLDTAIQMIKQAARVESGEPDIYKEQGAIFETKGEGSLAIEAYKQYFLLAPNAPDKRQLERRIEKLRGR